MPEGGKSTRKASDCGSDIWAAVLPPAVENNLEKAGRDFCEAVRSARAHRAAALALYGEGEAVRFQTCSSNHGTNHEVQRQTESVYSRAPCKISLVSFTLVKF